MTNLIEKSLLLGFSIFLLTIFSSILIPFLNEIHSFNSSNKNDLDKYFEFFDEVDKGICYTLTNPNNSYQNNVNYPKDLNITIFENFIIFEFHFRDDNFKHILKYNESFINRFFYNLLPDVYLLNVSSMSSYIMVNFLKLNEFF